MAELQEISVTPEAQYNKLEVDTVVDGIMAIAMCASVRGHDTIAAGASRERVIAEVINLIGWVGQNESDLLSEEWQIFMGDLHAHLNGRDWPSCRALMLAALGGQPELGVSSLGEVSRGFVELQRSDNGAFYFLKVLSSRGPARMARHALEAT